MTKAYFLAKVKNVHGNKYDYSKLPDEFKAKDKVTIICPVHGEFLQTPDTHCGGADCRKCSYEKRGKSRRKTSFKEEAKKVHGNKYDYSLVRYVNIDTNVTIICPEHGEFKQSPYRHLNKSGCPECSYAEIGKKLRFDLDSFIQKANKVHNNKYSYDKVTYTNARTDIIITCPKHGDFIQIPQHHLAGAGCKICNFESREKSSFSRDLESATYLYYFKVGDMYKIGVTKQKDGVYSRYTKDEYINFSCIKEWLLPSGEIAYKLERYFLSKYKDYVEYRDILRNGNFELFNTDVLTEEDIALIEQSYRAKPSTTTPV